MLYVAGVQYIEKPRNDQCTQSKCHTGLTTTYEYKQHGYSNRPRSCTCHTMTLECLPYSIAHKRSLSAPCPVVVHGGLYVCCKIHSPKTLNSLSPSPSQWGHILWRFRESNNQLKWLSKRCRFGPRVKKQLPQGRPAAFSYPLV